MSTATVSSAKPKVTAQAVKGGRPDLLKEIWDNGFRLEVNRIHKIGIHKVGKPLREWETVKQRWRIIFESYMHISDQSFDVNDTLWEGMWAIIRKQLNLPEAAWLWPADPKKKKPTAWQREAAQHALKIKSARSSVLERSGSTGEVGSSNLSGRSKLTIEKFNEFTDNMSVQTLQKDKIKKVISYNGKSFVSIGAMGTGTGEGWQSVDIVEVVRPSQWKGKTYHYHNHPSGTGYKGMIATFQNKTVTEHWVLTGKKTTLSNPATTPIRKKGTLKDLLEAPTLSHPELNLSQYIVDQRPAPDAPKTYTGGRNQRGVKHNIRNQVPVYKVFISGFLGNDPLFRELPVNVASYGFELSEKVIAEYWPGFKRSSVAKSNYVSGADIASLNNAGFPFDMWKDRYQNGMDRKAIFNFDFLKWFSAAAAKLDCDTFIYLDPTYLIGTMKKVEAEYYEHILTDVQHRDMLKHVLTTKANVMISCYDNPLYSKMLSGPKWRKIHFPAFNRHETVEETIYMNYPEPVKLADYSLLGDNHITRQMFKRKVARWMGKLAALPEKERNALLFAMREKYPA